MQVKLLSITVALVGVVTLVGCGPAATVQVETQIEPDGACRRNVYQPRKEFAPAEVLTPQWQARWEAVAGATAPPQSSQPSSPLKGWPYMVARGRFKSPDEIPEHYRYVNKEHPEVGASELRRSFRRVDYGLVSQYRWEERLTNIVTLEGFLKARDELLDLMIPDLVAKIEKRFDTEYDTGDLAAYIRSNGRRLAEDASVALYDAFAAKLPAKDIIGRLTLATERYGLAFRDPDGQPPSLDQVEKRFEQFSHRLAGERLRRRDGRAITATEIDRLFERLGSSAPADLAQDPQQNRIDSLVLRMCGLYNPLSFFFKGWPHFEFSLALPGELTETNGTLIGVTRAVWKFGGEELFPAGYTMRATSVALDTAAQEKLLERVVISDRAKALEFIALLGDDGPLVEAVRKAAQSGDRAALDRLPVQSLEDASRARQLRKLLGLE